MVGAVYTGPDLPLMKRPQDTIEALAAMVKAGDARGVASVCAYLAQASRDSPLEQVGRWGDALKEMASGARKTLNSKLLNVLPVLEEASAAVNGEYRRRAAAMDRPAGAKSNTDNALLDAAKNGDLEGVKKAVAEGADVFARDEKGMTAMEHAMGNEVYFDIWMPRHPEMVEFLRKTAFGAAVEPNPGAAPFLRDRVCRKP
ncbi:MAG: ankyrin repeat domain-containing protein [Candidatus Micrarchaeota archaeon]